MTSFSTVTTTPAPVDPRKHVNFTRGMVLGVDDFGQEFSYHAGRDQVLARDLVGAGTVRGLAVTISSDASEIIVAPGLALTPQGEMVHVPTAQCAIVRDWVTANAAAVAAALGGGSSGTVTVYIVLRYKSCLTDPVPIPGEPCRSEADAMAPSRVADSFQLDLLLSPPAPTEEPGMQALLKWLAAVPVASGAGTATAAGLVAALRTTFGPGAITSPAQTYAPPPASLTFGAGSIATMYRTAMQLYVTELRDDIAESLLGDAPGATAADAIPTETGILLGAVSLPVAQVATPNGPVWQFPAPPVVATSPSRPIVLPLAMLQEAWLTSSALLGTTAAAYRVVAAGMVPIKNLASDPDPAGLDPPLVPGLLALASQATLGDVTVTFPDAPGGGTHYVVKVVPIATAAPWPTVTLKSIATAPPSFTVHVSLPGGDPTLAQLTAMRLMVEVNAFAV